MTDTESPCDAHCGYYGSGRDLWEHIAWEHRDCTECGAKVPEWPDSLTHKPDCPRLQPGYVYPSTGSGYTRYDGPPEGDDDPYVNDVIGDLT